MDFQVGLVGLDVESVSVQVCLVGLKASHLGLRSEVDRLSVKVDDFASAAGFPVTDRGARGHVKPGQRQEGGQRQGQP